MDNGSLRPDAVFSLQRVASELSLKLGQTVEPVSVLHSNRVAADELNGARAEVFRTVIPGLLKGSAKELVILPFFLGPSNAILEYIPLTVEECFPLNKLRIRVAWPLCRNERDADLLAQAVIRQLGESSQEHSTVLVDHGTPRYEVHQVREWVREAMQKRGIGVRSCSMESREGPEYAFNRPLLEELLQEMTADGVLPHIAVALLFLLPGRHASENGDVDEICRNVLAGKGVDWRLSQVLGETPEVMTLLQRRWEELQRGDYWFSIR